MKIPPDIRLGLIAGTAKGFRIFTGIVCIAGYLNGMVAMEDVLNGKIIQLTGINPILAMLTLGAVTLFFFCTALEIAISIFRSGSKRPISSI